MSWSNKKQKAISVDKSSVEVAYKAMAATIKEVTWVGHLLSELYEIVRHWLLLYDNQSAIQISLNLV